jgi:hypothetical protein
MTSGSRQLERAFGVDLVYLNVSRRNLVMLQYKMLEPQVDWTFVPDDQLDSELVRMRRFVRKNPAPSDEYRLSPGLDNACALPSPDGGSVRSEDT